MIEELTDSYFTVSLVVHKAQLQSINTIKINNLKSSNIKGALKAER